MPRTKAVNEEVKTENAGTADRMSNEDIMKAVLDNPELLESLKNKIFENVEMAMASVEELKEDKITVTNFWDCQGGLEVVVPYGNGMIRRFSAFGEKQAMSESEFELFASSPVGSKLLSQRILGVSGNCPDHVARNVGLNKGVPTTDMVNVQTLNTLLDKSEEDILYTVSDLCEFHKIVIKCELEKAIKKGDSRVKRDLLVKLDKQNTPENGTGIFKHLIKLYDEIEEKS